MVKTDVMFLSICN